MRSKLAQYLRRSFDAFQGKILSKIPKTAPQVFLLLHLFHLRMLLDASQIRFIAKRCAVALVLPNVFG
jgi:hypothetical protein